MNFPANGRQTQVVLGVDGCRAGWVGVVLGPDGSARGVVAPTIGALVAVAEGSTSGRRLDVIGIDMPVHPPESGTRPADLAARAQLGSKAASIFLTPTRPVLAAASYADACAVARALDGRAISRQAWALRRKILEVGTWRAEAPCPVYEVHPEVSFSVLTGAPIMASKRTEAGRTLRRRALDAAGIDVPPGLDGAAGVGADDVLDAAVVAWSARRIAGGVARSFPDPPARLAGGGVDAIWA